MRQLTILYDGDCGFCRRCRRWLEAQPTYLPLRFVDQGSDEARRRWPRLASGAPPQELLVVSDTGGVYRGERAWIMVLYALRRYRSLALKLSQPALRPLARQAVHFIARHRHSLSRFVSDQRVLTRAARTPIATAHCPTPSPPPKHARDPEPARRDDALRALQRVRSRGAGLHDR